MKNHWILRFAFGTLEIARLGYPSAWYDGDKASELAQKYNVPHDRIRGKLVDAPELQELWDDYRAKMENTTVWTIKENADGVALTSTDGQSFVLSQECGDDLMRLLEQRKAVWATPGYYSTNWGSIEEERHAIIEARKPQALKKGAA